jgi:cobalt-zinc-cadmium efflux system outer membrane protein
MMCSYMKRCIFVIAFLCISPFCHAEQVLTLDSLVATLNERFPLIIAAEQERIQAEGRKRTALGAFDVTWRNRATIRPLGFYEMQRFDSVIEKPAELLGMNLFAGYRRGTGSFPEYEGKDVTTDGGEFRAGVQVPLLRNREIDERRGGLRSADLGILLADQSIALQKIDIFLRASLAYWTWVATGKKTEVIQSLLETARVRDDGIRERVLQGDLPEFERKDNQRSVLERESQLVAAERDFQEASITLSLFLRDESGNTLLPLKSQLPKIIPPPAMAGAFEEESLFKRALDQRPEIQGLMLEQKQNTVELELAENDFNPRLDFLMEVSKDVGGRDRTREPTELESGLFFEIPFQRRQAKGRIESAKARSTQINNQEKFFREQVLADVQDALSALRNARGQIEIVTREMKFAEELEEGERIRFRSGESTILVVNLREQATADSAVRKLEALAEYQRAEALLKAALGENY